MSSIGLECHVTLQIVFAIINTLRLTYYIMILHMYIQGPKPEGCCAEDIRQAWISYAPFNTKNGRVGSLGYVGCPGGGDWCYASNGPATSGVGGGNLGSGGNSQAQSVAAALAGLGSNRPNVRDRVQKSYGIGSWKK